MCNECSDGGGSSNKSSAETTLLFNSKKNFNLMPPNRHIIRPAHNHIIWFPVLRSDGILVLETLHTVAGCRSSVYHHVDASKQQTHQWTQKWEIRDCRFVQRWTQTEIPNKTLYLQGTHRVKRFSCNGIIIRCESVCVCVGIPMPGRLVVNVKKGRLITH